MRNFGFVTYDRVAHVGTNGKMNELSAAMGLTSLEAMPEFIEVNRANYERYREGLTAVPGLRVLPYDERERCNYQYVVVEVDEDRAGIDRDQLVRVLHSEGVLARRYFHPGCHRMEPYRSYFPHAGLLLPVTERLADRIFSVPTGTAVDGAAVDGVCRILATIVQSGPEVARLLRERDGAGRTLAYRPRVA
jgi:dTDP-4-amino-4,6-dideoxygalactose transaminase